MISERSSYVKSDRSQSFISDRSQSIIVDENKEKLSQSWWIYLHFLLANHKWLVVVFIALPFTAYAQYLQMKIVETLGEWIENQTLGEYFYLIWFGFCTCTIIGWYCMAFYFLHSANKLFKAMISWICRAPLNNYFDVTLTGSIINWLSKDMNTVDRSFE